MKVAMAWYSSDEYEKIWNASVDPGIWSESYETWLREAEATFIRLLVSGGEVEKVPLVLDELNIWLTKNKEQNNAKGRSKYAASKLNEIQHL